MIFCCLVVWLLRCCVALWPCILLPGIIFITPRDHFVSSLPDFGSFGSLVVAFGVPWSRSGGHLDKLLAPLERLLGALGGGWEPFLALDHFFQFFQFPRVPNAFLLIFDKTWKCQKPMFYLSKTTIFMIFVIFGMLFFWCFFVTSCEVPRGPKAQNSCFT